MKAAVVVEPERLEVLDVPEPEAGPYEALVQTLAGGLCGTDRHILGGTFYRPAYPGILGHESLGRVVEVGSAVRNLERGDLVLRTTAVRPGEQLGGFGSLLGAFAEVAIATDVQAMEEDGREGEINPYDRLQRTVPAAFDAIDAGALIVFKETLSWLRRLGEIRGKRVLVIGTGAAALSLVQIAKAEGARQVIALGRREARTARAREVGADEALIAPPGELAARVRDLTDGEGVDLVAEMAGATDALEAAPECLAPGGIVGVYGMSAGQAGTFRWGWERPAPRAWSLRFEEPDEAGVHEEALAWIADGRFDLRSTLTDVLPLADVVEGFAAMRREDGCKVAIDFSERARAR